MVWGWTILTPLMTRHKGVLDVLKEQIPATYVLVGGYLLYPTRTQFVAIPSRVSDIFVTPHVMATLITIIRTLTLHQIYGLIKA
jgi:hypothetical protein